MPQTRATAREMSVTSKPQSEADIGSGRGVSQEVRHAVNLLNSNARSMNQPKVTAMRKDSHTPSKSLSHPIKKRTISLANDTYNVPQSTQKSNVGASKHHARSGKSKKTSAILPMAPRLTRSGKSFATDAKMSNYGTAGAQTLSPRTDSQMTTVVGEVNTGSASAEVASAERRRMVLEDTGTAQVSRREEIIENVENQGSSSNGSGEDNEGNNDENGDQEDDESTNQEESDQEILSSHRHRPRSVSPDPSDFPRYLKHKVEEMVEISRQIGQILKRSSWKVIRRHRPCNTDDGKCLEIHLIAMVRKFGEVVSSSGAEDSGVHVRNEIVALIGLVSREAGIIVNKLGKPTSNPQYSFIARKRLLKDIYFRLVPQLAAVLESSVEAGIADLNSNNNDRKGLSSLIRVISKLSAAALTQPKDVQPIAPSGKDKFQARKPMRRINKLAGELQMKIQESSQPARTVQERLQIAKEREQAFRRRAQEENAERMNKIREIHRAQWAHLRSVPNPQFGQFYSSQNTAFHARGAPQSPELGRPERTWRNPHLYKADNDGFHDLADESDDEDDPFAEDEHGRIDFQNPERVEVFGKDNARNANIMRPWTDDEKISFIDVMMTEQGHDRYMNLAKRLDRSGDDIFVLAKDCQEAMDAAHEKGKLTEPCDDWTYKIYVKTSQVGVGD